MLSGHVLQVDILTHRVVRMQGHMVSPRPNILAKGSKQLCILTQRPLSSSFLGLPYRILNINNKKELLRGLWVLFNQSLKLKP